ncbi:keratin-associated protein 19-2-like [Chrysoperla carnea]|uniref:keratin-associated protein 19-2-like n=1 Tax=Chrysoperla carnea TaxID=189513 RepID=UPI001D06C726|nr:keratin-associated protein 19-2-like [Chrysoperla carnea]
MNSSMSLIYGICCVLLIVLQSVQSIEQEQASSNVAADASKHNPQKRGILGGYGYGGHLGGLYGGYGYGSGLGYGHGYGYGIPIVKSYHQSYSPIISKVSYSAPLSYDFDDYGHGLGYGSFGYGGGSHYGGLGYSIGHGLGLGYGSYGGHGLGGYGGYGYGSYGLGGYGSYGGFGGYGHHY